MESGKWNVECRKSKAQNVPRSTSHVPRPTFHVPRSTSHVPRSTSHVPLSTFHLLLLTSALCASAPGCRTYYVTVRPIGIVNNLQTDIPVTKTVSGTLPISIIPK